MGKDSYYLTFLLLFVFTVGMAQDDEYEWKLVKSQKGIKSFVKKNPNTKIRSVKVETIVEATLSELFFIITNTDSHSDWVYLNDHSEIIERTDNFNWINYGLVDIPWPISDRDHVTIAKMTQDSIDHRIILKSSSLPNIIPEKEDCIRIQMVESCWCLNPLGNGSVHITFELTTDVGGSIPIWLVNMAVAKGPTQTMQGLIKIVESNKYSDVSIDYIREF